MSSTQKVSTGCKIVSFIIVVVLVLICAAAGKYVEHRKAKTCFTALTARQNAMMSQARAICAGADEMIRASLAYDSLLNVTNPINTNGMNRTLLIANEHRVLQEWNGVLSPLLIGPVELRSDWAEIDSFSLRIARATSGLTTYHQFSISAFDNYKGDYIQTRFVSAYSSLVRALNDWPYYYGVWDEQRAYFLKPAPRAPRTGDYTTGSGGLL